MGGTLRLLREGGVDVRAVIATEGECGTRQPVTGTRRAEQLVSFAGLGIEARFLGLPDGGLAGVAELAQRLAEEVEAFAPTLVFGPHRADPHADHAALAAAVTEPCWRWLGWTKGLVATHFVDLGAAGGWQAKERLIRQHASQIPDTGESRAHLPLGLDILQRAQQRDREAGRQVGVEFAEPFVLQSGGGVPRLVGNVGDLFGGRA